MGWINDDEDEEMSDTAFLGIGCSAWDAMVVF